jgi:hypothetical protein
MSFQVLLELVQSFAKLVLLQFVARQPVHSGVSSMQFNLFILATLRLQGNYE